MNVSNQMKIDFLGPIYDNLLSRFSKFQVNAKEEIYNRFKDIENLRNIKTLPEENFENVDFQGKIMGWLHGCGVILIKVFTLLWFPICWFVVTRRGYNIGGVNVNDFPYRNPSLNRKSFSNISKIYEQAGGKRKMSGAGGPLKFTIIGTYDSVEAPYQILSEQDNSIVGGFKIWAIDSLATISALGRLMLSMLLNIFTPLTGFDNAADSNLFKFMLSIPIGYIMCPLILLGGMLLITIFGMIILVLKVKDYWWPFVGSRTFSPVALIFFMIILGLFAPYGSLILAISFFFAMVFSTIHWFGIMLFIIGAPIIFIAKKLRSGESEQIGKLLRGVGNGSFWIYMLMILYGPTKIIWGNGAALGGLAYLIFLAFSTRGQILKN